MSDLRTAIKEAMKRSKASVDYSKGKPDAHCGICEYYDRHACEKVKGTINPSEWCILFKKKN